MRGLLFALGVAASAAACSPTCSQSCNKLETCDLLGTVTSAECKLQCTRELSSTRDTDPSGDGTTDFSDERQCIADATCAELAAGDCREPGLLPFRRAE